MATQNFSGHTDRLAHRLMAARRGRFVGREAEIQLFRSAILPDEPQFVLLYVSGPGGVGKTTLLREYARLAEEAGRPVVALDGRDIEPSPPGFLLALRLTLGLEESSLSRAVPDLPPRVVLLVDTYESLEALDAWLRETFLPQLPAQSLVVIAGRNSPSPAWRTDVDWGSLTRTISLRNLRAEESQTYLTVRGVPLEHHPQVVAFTHGHPMALALVADVLSRGDRLAAFNLWSEPDMVRVLLERLVQEVPGAQHRLALHVSVLAWATTEDLLANVLELPDSRDLFEWLCRLSFMEYGPFGLFPHDLAREVLDADLRWRNPDSHRQLVQRLTTYLHARFQQARGAEQQRIWFDLLYLHRYNPFFKPYFEWTALGSAYAEPASATDYPAILAMVQQHQGEDSANIARYWLQRQPQAFLVYRSLQGELFGFMAHLALHQATAEDIAADPAVPAALDFVQRHGPARPGEEIVHLRFWMSRDAYQGVSPALNLTAINSSIYWLTHPRLAWNFVTTAEPEFLAPHFTSIHIWRAPEADFEVAGRRYGIFAHDWRVEPAAAWLNIKADMALYRGLEPEQPPALLPPPLLVLSEAEFSQAVRQAFRDYNRPDRLAANPLLRSRLVADSAKQAVSPAALQALLLEAADALRANPKDTKLHRAVWYTYLEPVPTQEQAAELLNLPFNTYRYHLARGLERITAWLWQRELNAANP